VKENDMKLFGLRDYNDNEPYGVIISKSTTGLEVQGIIDEIKTEVEDYSVEDVRNRLPNDCTYIPLDVDEIVYF
jgi:hypothetical protein